MIRNHWRVFYAPDGEGGGAPAPAPASQGGSPAPTPTPAPAQEGTQGQPTGKTYTQEQVNAMMATEKRTARQALFKELGLEYDDKSYKTSLENAKKTLDAGKTQAQLDAEARKRAETDLTESQKVNQALQAKIAALSTGVKPEYLDDIIALALPKVDDKTNLDAALKSLKERYPGSFNGGEAPKGTGGPTNPARKTGNQQDSLGKRLAGATKHAPAKSNFFNN